MRWGVGVVYWTVVGLSAAAGVRTSVLDDSPPYVLLAALLSGMLGAWHPVFRHSWAALGGFGALPVLSISSRLWGQIVQADWSCLEMTFVPVKSVVYGYPPGEEWCSAMPGQLVVVAAVLWLLTLSGTSTHLYISLDARTRATTGEVGLGTKLLGAVLLPDIAIAFLASVSEKAPQGDQTGGVPVKGQGLLVAEPAQHGRSERPGGGSGPTEEGGGFEREARFDGSPARLFKRTRT